MSLYFVTKLLQKVTTKLEAMAFNNVVNTLGLVLTGLSVAVFRSIINIFECRPNPNGEDTLKNYDGFHCNGDDVLSLLPVVITASLVFIGGTGLANAHLREGQGGRAQRSRLAL